MYLFVFSRGVTFNRVVESFGPAGIMDRASTCPGKTDETDRSIWALGETGYDFIHSSETLCHELKIINPRQKCPFVKYLKEILLTVRSVLMLSVHMED